MTSASATDRRETGARLGPLGLGVGAGVLVPGDHLPLGGLGFGQAGARVEGPPVADRVLEAVEEPVGEGPGLERLAVLAPVDGPPDPVPGPGAAAELLDVPEPDVVTVHLLLLLSVLRVCFQAAQPLGERAAPDPHPAARQPHDCRAGSLPAPAVERGPGHPQLGGHLLDRQQRVARGSGACVRGGGGPAGSGRVPGGGPSVGPRRRTLRSARRVKSGPRRAGGGRWPGAAGPGNGERGGRAGGLRGGAGAGGRPGPAGGEGRAGAGAGSRAVTSARPRRCRGWRRPAAGRRGGLACRPGPQASTLDSARRVKSARHLRWRAALWTSFIGLWFSRPTAVPLTYRNPVPGPFFTRSPKMTGSPGAADDTTPAGALGASCAPPSGRRFRYLPKSGFRAVSWHPPEPLPGIVTKP